MFNLKLDHVVHTVRDPEEASTAFSEQFDWTPIPGGRHEHMGTYNWLHYFDLAYVEWVSVFSEDIAKASEFGRWVLHDWLNQEGLSQFVLRTSEMDDIVQFWKGKGLRFVGPIQASRRRPDGSVLTWRMLFPERQNGQLFPLPFVIEWDGSDEERRRGLVESGALPPSGKSSMQLLAIHSLVQSVEATLARWNEYFPLSEEPQPLEGALGVGSCIWNDGVAFCFWPAESEEIRLQLERVGERPFQMDAVSQRHRMPSREQFVQGLTQTKPALSRVHGLRVRILE